MSEVGSSVRPLAGPVARDLGADVRGPIGGFRAIVIAGCGLLSLLPPRHPSALLVLLVLGLGAWVAYRWPATERGWPYLGAVLAAAAVPVTGGARSPLLPYLLAPGLSMGLRGGPYDVLVMSGTLWLSDRWRRSARRSGATRARRRGHAVGTAVVGTRDGRGLGPPARAGTRG